MLEVLAPPLRILAMAAFLLLAKQGWFTWLTPENAHDLANQVMDFLVVAVPAAYALWAAFKAWRQRRARKIAAKPENLIERAASLPDVAKIEVHSMRLAGKIPSPKVVA